MGPVREPSLVDVACGDSEYCFDGVIGIGSLAVPRSGRRDFFLPVAAEGLTIVGGRSRVHHAPRGVGHGSESIGKGHGGRRHCADGDGAAAGDRQRRPHPGPSQRRHRREPAERTRLPGRLAARLQCHRARVRRRRRRLAGHVHRAVGRLRVQGGARRRLGRELRRQRRGERCQHRPWPRSRHRRHLLLRPRDPLGDRRRQLGDRHRGGKLPERARLHGRLAAGLSPVVVAGSRRRRSLRVRHRPDPGRQLRVQGRPRRGLERELSRRQRRVHRGRRQHGRVHL